MTPFRGLACTRGTVTSRSTSKGTAGIDRRARRAGDEQPLADEGRPGEAGAVLVGREHPEVEIAGVQEIADLDGTAVEDSQTQARRGIEQHLDERAGQDRLQRRRQADGDAAARVLVAAGELAADVLDLVEQTGGALAQHLAGLGQHDAAAVTLEERRRDLVLELPDLAAERRLGQLELGRGAADIANLGEFQEGVQKLRSHRPPCVYFIARM